MTSVGFSIEVELNSKPYSVLFSRTFIEVVSLAVQPNESVAVTI